MKSKYYQVRYRREEDDSSWRSDIFDTAKDAMKFLLELPDEDTPAVMEVVSVVYERKT